MITQWVPGEPLPDPRHESFAHCIAFGRTVDNSAMLCGINKVTAGRWAGGEEPYQRRIQQRARWLKNHAMTLLPDVAELKQEYLERVRRAFEEGSHKPALDGYKDLLRDSRDQAREGYVDAPSEAVVAASLPVNGLSVTALLRGPPADTGDGDDDLIDEDPADGDESPDYIDEANPERSHAV